METIIFVDVVELYMLIVGVVFLCLIGLFWLFSWLWENYIYYIVYKIKRKFKKV